jgi:hypothetical protein
MQGNLFVATGQKDAIIVAWVANSIGKQESQVIRVLE